MCRLRFFAGNVVQLGVDAQVLFDGQVEVAGQRLRDHAHGAARVVRIFRDVEAGDARRAGGDRHQRGHHADQR